MIKAEFHTHTHYSHDSFLGKFAYLFMLKLRKINAVAVTDHNTIEGAQYLKPFLEKHGIKVIIGEEIFTSQGEIIGLFLKENIPPCLTAKETAEEIKKQGGIVYVPHPYDTKRSKTVLKEDAIASIKTMIDVMEIHNGRNISDVFSEKQKELAERYNICPIIGSDAHTAAELGRNYIIINDFTTAEELLTNLKSATFVTKKVLKSAHTATKVVRLLKLAAAGKFNEILRIIKRKFRNRNKTSA